jgi:hypothetical protein
MLDQYQKESLRDRKELVGLRAYAQREDSLIGALETELARLHDTLRDYRNALRVCRDAMSCVMTREKTWRLRDPNYAVIDGGSLTMALDFTANLETANQSTIGMLRARIEKLEEDDRVWEKHGLTETVRERDRLRVQVESASKTAGLEKTEAERLRAALAGFTTHGMEDVRVAWFAGKVCEFCSHPLCTEVRHLRAGDEAAKGMADFLRNLRYHHTNELVRRWEEAGR